jgi:hypothetical protein
MRTITGEYRIDFFDKYGKRCVGLSMTAFTLRQANDAAKVRLMELPDASYTIMRCVFNSLDTS